MSKQNKKTKSEGVAPQVMVVAVVVAFLFGVYVGGVSFSLVQDKGDEPQGQMRMPGKMPGAMPGGAPGKMPPQQMPPQMSAQDSAPSEDQAAILKLEAQVKSNPKDLGAWIHLGNLYFDSHQFKNAIRTYSKALDLDPKNANVWTDLGVMYRRDKQPEKAIECFDKAIAADSAHRTARFNKGIVYLHDLNDKESALQTWEVVLQEDPEAAAPDGRPLQALIDELRKQK